MHQKLSKLKSLPEACLDRQAILIGKHQLLAELSKRQEQMEARKASLEEKTRLFMYRTMRKLMPTYQKVLVFGLVVALTLSTGFIAQAAVPGDVLWSVKITIEKAEVVLAFNAAQEGRVHMRHVDNRLKELSVVVANPDLSKKNENISRLIRRLEKDITAAGQSLKVSREEEKNTKPQVIIALAQDLSAKASEAAKILEQNRKTLEVSAAEAQLSSTTAAAPTTTEPIVLETLGTSSTPSTSLQTVTSTEAEESPVYEPSVMDIITEVQLVNEYISYDAIRSLVEFIAQGRGTSGSRQQASVLLTEKITEQEGRLVNLEEVTALITDDFLLHKKQAETLNTRARGALKKAGDNVYLGYLTQAVISLTEAKDVIQDSTKLLGEVASLDGFIDEEDVPAVSEKEMIVPTVKIQTIESTEPSATETIGEYDDLDKAFEAPPVLQSEVVH